VCGFGLGGICRLGCRPHHSTLEEAWREVGAMQGAAYFADACRLVGRLLGTLAVLGIVPGFRCQLSCCVHHFTPEEA